MKITEISSQLATAYTERAELQVALGELKNQLFRREVELTPAEGWPGKNAEMRDLEKARSLASDDAWTTIANNVTQANLDMVQLSGVIEALEAQRRGAEWSIRENLVAVLAYNLRGQQTPATEAESLEQAFDDVSDSLVDDEIFYTAGEELADHETPRELAEAVVEELPF